MSKKEIENARYKWLLETHGFDYVIETRDGGDFTEFILSTGGDVTRVRVYGTSEADFDSCEK